MLNRNQIDVNVVLQTYRDVLKEQAARLNALRSGSKPSGETTEDPKPADSSGAPVGNLQNLNLLLQELNPDIKREFLTVTFEQCNTEDAANWTDEFLGNFSEDLVADMLRQENQKGREISLTLLGYIQKFSETETASPIERESTVTDPADNQRGTAEDYTDSDNDPLLKQAAGEMPSATSAAKELLPVQDILGSLEDSQLCTKIAVLLMSFMKDDCAPEKYKAYGVNLVDVADELLEAGQFALLKNIMSKIIQQGRGKGTPENQTVAQELSETWQSPAFASKAVHTILGLQEEIDPQGYAFLLALGPRIVPDLVNYYGKQKNPDSDESLLKLLTEFKAESATEAQKRLRDSRPEYVRNMVKFLRRINAQKVVPQLRALMETSNTSVQMEVLVALLEFKDGWAAYHLRKMLQSDRSEIASRAIAMAAQYKVKEIVPDLLAMLKTLAMFKTDIQRNEQIIAALGQIGDTAAIPALLKLAKSGGLFQKEELLHMKQVLFTSLQGYPMDAVGQLLQIGQKSKDKNIRNACRKITARAN